MWMKHPLSLGVLVMVAGLCVCDRAVALHPHFVEDLIGLQAVTGSGKDLGKIVQVISQPAGDIYETDREVLIPAVKAFVALVDLPGRRIVVHDIAGLLPEEQEEG